MHKGVNALESAQNDAATDDEMEELHSFLPHLANRGTATREELNAFFRRTIAGKAAARQPGGGGRPEARRPGRETPARDCRDIKCPNCGKIGHTKEDCKAPKLALSDRACFERGETGHTAAKCPKKKTGHAKTIKADDVPAVVDFNLFEAVPAK